MRKVIEIVVTLGVGLVLAIILIEAAWWSVEQGESVRIVGLAAFMLIMAWCIGQSVMAAVKSSSEKE